MHEEAPPPLLTPRPGVAWWQRLEPFRPRLLDSLAGYNRQRFLADLAAGLTVAIVALPLAMAFGIASGVKPEYGLFTAILAGFLISALGGSNVQIGGPAGAFIVIVYGIIERYGLANLLIATSLAGVLLFLMGLFRVGGLVRFIPVAVVVGFTNGIAVLIGLSQVKDLFGLQVAKLPADFIAQIRTLWAHAHTVNVWALAVGLACTALVVLWPKSYQMPQHPQGLMPHVRRWSAHLPGTLVALVLATLAVAVFNLPVETIGSRFGGIPQQLPGFALPEFSWATAQRLVMPTVTIALLGAIESLLCARVADNMVDLPRHNPNQELMAQGVANFVVPFFGGIPATGTIARTVTNVRAGGTTPVAGIVHAAALLLIMLLAAPLASHVPLAALAGILVFVAWNMGEWKAFAHARRFSLNYRAILFGTFVLTVLFDLTVAVEVGLILACGFFIWRMGQLFRIDALPAPAQPAGAPPTQAFELYGTLFFGAVAPLEDLPTQVAPETRVVRLHLLRLVAMDTTGLDALEQAHRALDKRGVRVQLVEPNAQPLALMRRAGFIERLGPDAVLWPDGAGGWTPQRPAAPDPAPDAPSRPQA